MSTKGKGRQTGLGMLLDIWISKDHMQTTKHNAIENPGIMKSSKGDVGVQMERISRISPVENEF